MNALKLPIDLQLLQPFKELSKSYGFAEALAIWFLLWKDLGYRAQEGNPPGRFPKTERSAVENTLSEFPAHPDNSASQAFDALVNAKVLVDAGFEYVCPKFASLNSDMGSGRSNAQRGGDMRAFEQKRRKLPSEAMQLGLSIHHTKLVDAEGNPLNSEQVSRMTRLIVTCDNALFRPLRPPYGFGEGLIQEALRVLDKFTDEEIDLVCRKVAGRRDHPALNGMNTEKLLPMFGEILGRIE